MLAGGPDDSDDEAAAITTNLTVTCWANATNEDVAAPETTVDPNQLKTFGGWRGEPSVDDTILRGYVYSQNTELVRGRLVDDMKNDRAKSRFVAAEVTGDVMRDVHTGTPVLKTLRTTIILAKKFERKHRLRDSALYGTTVTVAQVNLDEAVGFSPQGGLLEEEEAPFGAYGKPRYSDGFEAAAATLLVNSWNAWVDGDQSDAWYLSTSRSC